MSWKFFIERHDWSRRMRLFGGNRHEGGSVDVIKPMVFERQPDGALVEDPWCEMHEDDARPMLQALVDECWRVGIKPTGHDDFKRINDAQGRHLDDMRRIVGKLADVPLDNARHPPP